MVRTKDRITLGVMPGAPETSCDIADVLKCIVDMQLELLQQSNHPAFGGSAR